MRRRIWLPLLLCAGSLLVQAQNCCSNDRLHIMSYNIRNGIGMDQVKNLDRTAEVINKWKPQLVAVQEVDSVTRRSNGTYILGELAGKTDMYPVYSPAIAFDGGKYGIGILSREKPLKMTRYALPGREEKRTLLVAEYEEYVFACTHLSLNAEDQLQSLPIIRKAAEATDKPFFIAGDLNAHPDSELIAELQKDFEVLSVTDTPTWPADVPTETLDYIAVRRKDTTHLSTKDKSVLEEPVASDHRPITVTIEMQ